MPRPVTRTFAASPCAKWWSTNNHPTTPGDVAIRTANLYQFQCPECRHQFTSSPDRLARHGCPYCCNRGKLCDLESCEHCSERRFASVDKSRFCRDRSLPFKVPKNSNTKVEFVCGECQHEFKATPNNVTSGGTWCPFCVNKKRCSPDTIHECVLCWNQAFISHEKSGQWMLEENEFRTPLEEPLYSNKKFWFRCDKDQAHEFKMRLADVSKGIWCPQCRNKTEELVYKWCHDRFPDTIRQKRFSWNSNRPFDIYIESLSTIIEVDGDQHFKNVMFWNSYFEKQQERDAEKMQGALKNNKRIVRIRQRDVWNTPEIWKRRLEETLREIECHQLLSLDEEKFQFLSADEAAYNSLKQILGRSSV